MLGRRRTRHLQCPTVLLLTVLLCDVVGAEQQGAEQLGAEHHDVRKAFGQVQDDTGHANEFNSSGVYTVQGHQRPKPGEGPGPHPKPGPGHGPPPKAGQGPGPHPKPGPGYGPPPKPGQSPGPHPNPGPGHGPPPRPAYGFDSPKPHQADTTITIQHSGVLVTPLKQWPNKMVYYAYADDKLDRHMIERALNQYRNATCIKIIEVARNFSKPHLVVGHHEKSCSSNVDRYSNLNIYLTSTCAKQIGIILRELGHVIGLRDEHSRPDRDEYVKVHLEHVPVSLHVAFTTYMSADTYGTMYDYTSVMQYGINTGSSGGSEVLESRQPAGQYLMGTAKVLSHWDIVAANRAYACFDDYAAKCKVPANYCRQGLLEHRKHEGNGTYQCWCSCAAGTSGPTCEKTDTPYLEAMTRRLLPRDVFLTAPRGHFNKTVPTEEEGETRWVLRAPVCHKIKVHFTKFDFGRCPVSSSVMFTEYTHGSKPTNHANIVCTQPKHDERFNMTFDTNKLDIIYSKKKEEVSSRHDYGFALNYEFVRDVKCTSACVEGNCPAPLLHEHMTVLQVGYYLDHIKSNFSWKVKVMKYGTTKSGHPLNIVIIRPYMQKDVRNAKHVVNRQSVFVEAGMDARNRVPTYVALHLIHETVTKCTSNCTFDYYVVPLANPDGHDYTMTKNLHNYAKNLESTKNASCKGVNVFYNFKEASIPGDTDPCSQTYQGPSKMSTAEVKYLVSIKKNVKNILATVVLNQEKQIADKGLITVPELDSMGRYFAVADSFLKGVSGVNKEVKYHVGTIKELPLNGSVLHYNQKTFGNTYRISFPTYSLSELSRLETSFKEFMGGFKYMIKHLS